MHMRNEKKLIFRIFLYNYNLHIIFFASQLIKNTCEILYIRLLSCSQCTGCTSSVLALCESQKYIFLPQLEPYQISSGIQHYDITTVVHNY